MLEIHVASHHGDGSTHHDSKCTVNVQWVLDTTMTCAVHITHHLGSLKTLQAARWNVNMQSAMVAYLKPSERPASCHDANSCHDSIVALAILTGVSVAVAAGLRASGCWEGT